MKTKHTPGPWSASAPDGEYHDVIRIYAATVDSKPVAVCPQMDSPIMAILKGQTNETTEAAANARLIAAAPDLLEALEMVRDADEDAKRDGLPTIPATARARIDAAIAKATGNH